MLRFELGIRVSDYQYQALTFEQKLALQEIIKGAIQDGLKRTFTGLAPAHNGTPIVGVVHDIAAAHIELEQPAYNPDHQIILTWGIDDVQSSLVRPDLTDEEAMQVLAYAKQRHDPNHGIAWDTHRIIADDLFPQERRIPCSFVSVWDTDHEIRTSAELNLANGRIENIKQVDDPNISTLEWEYIEFEALNLKLDVVFLPDLGIHEVKDQADRSLYGAILRQYYFDLKSPDQEAARIAA